jgi:hypothetical protein
MDIVRRLAGFALLGDPMHQAIIKAQLDRIQSLALRRKNATSFGRQTTLYRNIEGAFIALIEEIPTGRRQYASLLMAAWPDATENYPELLSRTLFPLFALILATPDVEDRAFVRLDVDLLRGRQPQPA